MNGLAVAGILLAAFIGCVLLPGVQWRMRKMTDDEPGDYTPSVVEALNALGNELDQIP